MSKSEELKYYLRLLKEGILRPEEGKTHMFELFRLMKEGLAEFGTTEELNYTNAGESLSAVVKFADGRYYSIEIKEERY